MKSKCNLLVCDLDNTLYDWFAYFVPSFYAMVDEAVKILSCDRDVLLDDLRQVHRKHGDVEHPFSLLETAFVRSKFSDNGGLAKVALDPAFHAFNKTRIDSLRLHDGVRETLELLLSNGVRIVAHTEGKFHSVRDRLLRLDLARYFSRVYCRERSATQHPAPNQVERSFSGFPENLVVELSQHQTKPDAEVLLEICRREGSSVDETAYVGDSVARDILMASRAGAYSIWAKYGSKHDPEEYEKLVRVTHWTDDDVAREKDLKNEASRITADFVCERGFYEIVDFIDWQVSPPSRAFLG